MFASLKAEVSTRCSQIAEVLRLAAVLERNGLTGQSNQPGLKSLRGLIFVQFYAVYEYTLIQSFSRVVDGINAMQIPLVRLKRSLLGLVLHAQFESLQSLKTVRSWTKRLELLSEAESLNLGRITDALFPFDENHFRDGQLDKICLLLGLPQHSLVPDRRIIGYIHEWVENRNAVAHGRKTAEDVGGGYTCSDLQVRLTSLESVCSHIVMTFETYIGTPQNCSR